MYISDRATTPEIHYVATAEIHGIHMEFGAYDLREDAVKALFEQRADDFVCRDQRDLYCGDALAVDGGYLQTTECDCGRIDRHFDY